MALILVIARVIFLTKVRNKHNTNCLVISTITTRLDKAMCRFLFPQCLSRDFEDLLIFPGLSRTGWGISRPNKSSECSTGCHTNETLFGWNQENPWDGDFWPHQISRETRYAMYSGTAQFYCDSNGSYYML